MALVKKTYTLDKAAVDAISASIQTYLNELGMERRSVQRIRLTVEELLLNILSQSQAELRVETGMGKQFGRHVLRLYYKGEALDPVRYGENAWSDDLMRNLGYAPAWSYKRGVNTVSLVLAEKARRSTVFYLLVAVLAAVLLGLAGKLLAESFRQSLDEVLLLPLSKAFLGLMSTFSGIMIALTICNGILGIGDSMSLGKTGRRIILRFTGLAFLVCLVTLAFAVPVLGLSLSGNASGGSSQSGQISHMIFDILPSDPITPFLKGNTLQIMVISILAGIGLIAIGERGRRIRNLVDEGTALTQHTVSLICSFVPLFVFVMLLRLIWNGEALSLLSVWKPLLLIFGLEALLAFAFLLVIAAKLKCPPMTLFRTVFPPFAVAFSSASSMAAMPLSLEICEKKMGVEKSLLSFAYPVGSVIYMPASTVSFTMIACFFAEHYQVEISWSWLIMAWLSVTLLVIAMPPIPGAGLLVTTILLAQLGIPGEALALAAAMDVVVDFCNTGFNVLFLNLQMAYENGALSK